MTHDDTHRTLDITRRRADLLRRQLYWQADPSQAPELWEALLATEAELHRLEQDSPPREPAENTGTLLDTTGPKAQTMGSGDAWTVRLELRQSHIPTGIVHLFEATERPLVSAAIQFQGDELARLRVSCWVEGYSDLAIETSELTLYSPEVEIRLLPVFRAPAVREINELRRATLHFQVLEVKSNRELYRTFPIWLLPQSSAYLWIVDPVTRKRIDLTPYLGAWVTPNEPAVMQTLRAAAGLHPRKALGGYQEGPEGVARQVEAIYQALRAEQVAYIQSVLAFGAVAGMFQQRVRLPREALANHSANCLDGTLLMASLLEAASLNPGIVLVPGHALLAWETGEGSGSWEYLETTMIGTSEFAVAQQAGRTLASRWEGLQAQTGDPWSFLRLSLRTLRLEKGITPLS
jgi:hypothetical protein